MRVCRSVLKLIQLCTILGLGGCAYMVTPRDGSFYPSTYQINHNPSGQWFPSVGSVIASSGLLVPYIGPCLTYPVGYPIHYAEAIAVAPAIDTALLPVDLCFRPSYLKKNASMRSVIRRGACCRRKTLMPSCRTSDTLTPWVRFKTRNSVRGFRVARLAA